MRVNILEVLLGLEGVGVWIVILFQREIGLDDCRDRVFAKDRGVRDYRRGRGRVIQQTGVGFTQRDEGAKNQENQGIIEFVIAKNDQQRDSMRKLLDLKNIFSRQLPKMPKEYIVKLVFDRNHESMMIVKDKTKVVGGICYRIYPTQKFAEVAFLAITASEQVRGYGTRLMNKYKEEMQKREIEYLMTYADNFALGYFRKQGFTKDYKMSNERWKGFIKDYEGGTMMECYVHPKLDYSNVSDIIKEQRQFVIEKVKSLCMNNKVYEGKSVLNKLVTNETNNVGGEEQVLKINPERIPGVVEGGWTWADHQQLKKTKERSFQLQCQNLLDTLRKFKGSWPFHEPVLAENVPDYYTIIKQPMDMKIIEAKIDGNDYPDKESLRKDLVKMFDNCLTYNQPDSPYHKAAIDCRAFIFPYLDSMRDKKDMIQQKQRNKSGGKGAKTASKSANKKKPQKRV